MRDSHQFTLPHGHPKMIFACCLEAVHLPQPTGDSPTGRSRDGRGGLANIMVLLETILSLQWIFTARYCSVLGRVKAKRGFWSYRAGLLDDIHEAMSQGKIGVAPLESTLTYLS